MNKQQPLPESAEFTADIQNFAAVLGAVQVAAYLDRHHSGVSFESLSDAHKRALLRSCTVDTHVGKTWVRIDIGGSGRYMVNSIGMIYGIKGYGVPNLVRNYGALNTLNFWNWSGYYASFRKPGTLHTPEFVAPAPVAAVVAPPTTASVSLTQQSRDSFTVRYGGHIRTGLCYAYAATEYGECLMHAMACDGIIKND